MISFIAMVDEKFELTLNPKQITACPTVNDLAVLLGDKIKG
jgi:acyl carrier protein